MLSILRNKGHQMENAGCGFLTQGEIEASLGNELSVSRRSAFNAHQVEGCSPCALLAADLQVWTDVERRGVLENERREFAADAAILKAHLRQELSKLDEQRTVAPSFKFSWNSLAGLAAAAMLAMVLIVPGLIEKGPSNVLPTPDGSGYAFPVMEYSQPVVRNGAAKAWREAGAAYTAAEYVKAERLLAAFEADEKFADREDLLHDSALLRGNALLMLGRYEEAVNALEIARERADRLGFLGGIDNFYLGLAAMSAGDIELATSALERAVEIGGIETADRARQLLDRLSATK